MTARLPAAIASLIALAAPAALADEVVLIPGSTVKAPGGRIRGAVTAETTTEIKVGNQSVPVDQVESVSYDGQPQSYTLAQLRETNGPLAEAADQYQKAATEAAGKPLIAQAAQFGRARAIARLAESDPSKADEALRLLDAVVKAGAKSRHLGPALELTARLALQKGEFDRAAAAATDLAKIPWAADRASILQARILGGRGQNDQALAALDKLLAAAPDGSPRRREVTLARAGALAGLKRYDDAEAAAREVIAAAEPEDAATLALAYNTLGDCLRSAGKPKDALYAYLHTDVLYDRDKDQHARSLAAIADLWRLMKQDARAEAVVERMKEEYPQSPYTASAGTAKP